MRAPHRFLARALVFAMALFIAMLASACQASFNVSTANIKDVVLARGADAKLNPVDPTTTFKPEDSEIHALVTLANAPSDTKIKAVWLAVDAVAGQPNYQMDSRELASGSGTIHFYVSNSNPWPSGRYRVDLYLNDKKDPAASREFTVVAPAATATPLPSPTTPPSPTVAPSPASVPPATKAPAPPPAATKAPTAAPPATLAPTPLPSAPAAGRQTYQNAQMGVSFTYPKDWEMSEETDQVSFTAPNETGGLLLVKQALDLEISGSTFAELFMAGMAAEFTGYQADAPKTIAVSGQPAVQTGFTANVQDEQAVGRLVAFTNGRNGYAMLLIMKKTEAGDIDSLLAGFLKDFKLLPVASSTAAPTRRPTTAPPTATARPAPTASTRPTAVPTASSSASGKVLFNDDFSSQATTEDNGWDFTPGDYVDYTWASRQFVISINKAQWLGLDWPDGEYGDFVAEAEGQASGSTYTEYGIVFRLSGKADSRSYYIFGLTNDGKYYMQKKIDGEWADQDPVPMASSSLIKKDAKNALSVRAIGTKISLYINGTLVKTITDDSNVSGAVGLYAGSGDKTPVKAIFSRLTIKNP